MNGVGMAEASRLLGIRERTVLAWVRGGILRLTPRTRWGYRLITRASVEHARRLERTHP